MKPPILAFACLTLTRLCVYGQEADASSFEVASVKPASPTASAISCSGGPGTSDPSIWSCSNVPLAFVISRAFGFEAYQFSPRDTCCQSRFDFTAKVPDGATKEQFQRMLQNLLVERFKLKLHHEQKAMAVYELTVGEKGPKLKESAPGAALATEDPGHLLHSAWLRTSTQCFRLATVAWLGERTLSLDRGQRFDPGDCEDIVVLPWPTGIGRH